MEEEAQVDEAHVEQEVPEEEDGLSNGDAEEEEGAPQGGGQQQQVNNKSVKFEFYLDLFLYEVTNSIFAGSNVFSWLHLLEAGRTGR
jgi:hypothetical protein